MTEGWGAPRRNHDRARHADRGRAESFGEQADRYDRVRPGYPDALFDEVLGPEPAKLSVLDVGCGTGIAARSMAARGAAVLGVEVDARMARLAREHGIAVEVAAFESWDPAGRSFDRVTAAQSWHWIDPVAGPAKAATVLGPSGRLCLFWNVGEQPSELAEALAALYLRLGTGVAAPRVQAGYETPKPGAVSPFGIESEAIMACPLLTGPVVSSFPWRRRYTRDEWLEQVVTHSDHATMPAEQRERLLGEVGRVIDDFGGSFEMSYTTWLLSASCRSSSPSTR